MEKVSRKLLEDIYSNNPWNGYDDVSFITNPEIKPNPNNIIGCEILSHSTSSVISNGCGITFLHGEDTKLDMSYLGKKGCVILLLKAITIQGYSFFKINYKYTYI